MCTEIKHAKSWSVLPIIFVTLNLIWENDKPQFYDISIWNANKNVFFLAYLIKQKISLDMVGFLRQSFNTICLISIKCDCNEIHLYVILNFYRCLRSRQLLIVIDTTAKVQKCIQIKSDFFSESNSFDSCVNCKRDEFTSMNAFGKRELKLSSLQYKLVVI